MAGEEFFEAPEEQSVIKTTLVQNYFKAWTKIMLPRVNRTGNRLAYVDLFSGPGQYDDGSASTPLWILDYAIGDSELRTRLATTFNDKNSEFTARLRSNIAALPGIEQLAHQPQVTNFEVGRDIVDMLRGGTLVPTLSFIDPFGYRGLSLALVGNAIKSWGCDCIFFFNYNRINAALTNPSVPESINDLFGAERAARLRQKVNYLTSDARRTTIISELTEAIKEVGGRIVLPFEFQSQHGVRPSHYVIFVSKAFIAYHIMKEVMWKESSDIGDVRSFKYVPIRSTQMSLFPDFGKDHSIPLLKDVLLQNYRGRVITVWDVYEGITPDTPYTLKNLKDALLELEVEERITIDPPAAQRPKRRGEVTLADNKRVTFSV